jgi:hypothetical protein
MKAKKSRLKRRHIDGLGLVAGALGMVFLACATVTAQEIIPGINATLEVIGAQSGESIFDENGVQWEGKDCWEPVGVIFNLSLEKNSSYELPVTVKVSVGEDTDYVTKFKKTGTYGTFSARHYVMKPCTQEMWKQGEYLTVGARAIIQYMTVDKEGKLTPERIGPFTLSKEVKMGPYVEVKAPAYAQEGQVLDCYVSIPLLLTKDLNVYLTSSNEDRLQVPGAVTVGAGKTTAHFKAHVLENGVEDGLQRVTMRATTKPEVSSTDGHAHIDIVD